MAYLVNPVIHTVGYAVTVVFLVQTLHLVASLALNELDIFNGNGQKSNLLSIERANEIKQLFKHQNNKKLLVMVASWYKATTNMLITGLFCISLLWVSTNLGAMAI